MAAAASELGPAPVSPHISPILEISSLAPSAAGSNWSTVWHSGAVWAPSADNAACRPLQKEAACQMCGTAQYKRQQHVGQVAASCSGAVYQVLRRGPQSVCWSGHAVSMCTCQGAQHSPGVCHGWSAALVCLAANSLARLGHSARFKAEG